MKKGESYRIFPGVKGSIWNESDLEHIKDFVWYYRYENSDDAKWLKGVKEVFGISGDMIALLDMYKDLGILDCEICICAYKDGPVVWRIPPTSINRPISVWNNVKVIGAS